MVAINDRNERLAEAMARAGMSSTDLAAVAEIDPRTVDRLVADRSRVPRAHSRHAIAKAVQVPVGMLWPGTSNGSHGTDELLAVYPSRASMPAGLVMSLLNGAQRQIDILALAAVWLWDAVPGFGPALASKAATVPLRICLGEPTGEVVRTRGAEEGIGDLLAGRCRLAVTYAQRFVADVPDAIRLHDTTLYASILRFDDDLLVNWHLYGSAAAEAPMFHLHKMSGYGLAERVASSFETGLADSSASDGVDQHVRPCGARTALAFRADTVVGSGLHRNPLELDSQCACDVRPD